MTAYLPSLIRLQEIQNALLANHGEPGELQRGRQFVRLRNDIPLEVSEHYHHQRSRKKRGVAPVVNGICRGCNMGVPRSTSQQLRSEPELAVCPNCGALLYAESEQLAAALLELSGEQPAAAETPGLT